MICPACNAMARDGARFCISCGAPLTNPGSTVSVSPPSRRRRRARPVVLVLAVLFGLLLIAGTVLYFAYPERVARMQLDRLTELAEHPPAATLAEVVPWQLRLNKALHRIDSDPRVLKAFTNLVRSGGRTARDRALGVETVRLVAVVHGTDDPALTSLRRAIAAASASPAWAALSEAAADPNTWISKKVGRLLRTLSGQEAAMEEAAKEPEWPEGKSHTLDLRLQQVANMFPARGTCAPGYVLLSESGNCIGDFGGTWKGRYNGTVTTPEGAQCTVGGPVTFDLRQRETQVTGTAYLGRWFVVYATCEQRESEEGFTQVAGSIDGTFLTMGSYQLRKESPNSASGFINGTVSFFVARAA